MLKSLGIVAKGLFILSLPLMLFVLSIAGAANSPWLYEYGFERYGVSQTTGLAQSELEKVATGLVSYFNSDEEFISITVLKDGKPFELFNEREKTHLKDVKGLIWLDYRVLLGTLIYILGYSVFCFFRGKGKYRRGLGWGVVSGSSLTLALMMALGLGTLLGFDELFLQFHLISFANELWQLDPARDYLIRLFPQGFFYDAALFISLATTGLAVILGGLAGSYLVVGSRVASKDKK